MSEDNMKEIKSDELENVTGGYTVNIPDGNESCRFYCDKCGKELRTYDEIRNHNCNDIGKS